MSKIDYTDYYILYEGHPKYNSAALVEDIVMNVILQKYEMILFTNRGDILGIPDFGADLERLLNQTKVSAKYVERIINDQISRYIPELLNIPYELEVTFSLDNEFVEILLINFKIREYEVNIFIPAYN